ADDAELLSSAIMDVETGIQVVKAENGSDALKYLRRAKTEGQLPCLIVLDINMPVLDGRETLQKIRQDISFRHVPVIVYTSSSSPNDRNFFNRFGIDMITKPASISKLPNIAERLLSFC